MAKRGRKPKEDKGFLTSFSVSAVAHTELWKEYKKALAEFNKARESLESVRFELAVSFETVLVENQKIRGDDRVIWKEVGDKVHVFKKRPKEGDVDDEQFGRDFAAAVIERAKGNSQIIPETASSAVQTPPAAKPDQSMLDSKKR